MIMCVASGHQNMVITYFRKHCHIPKQSATLYYMFGPKQYNPIMCSDVSHSGTQTDTHVLFPELPLLLLLHFPQSVLLARTMEAGAIGH